MGNLSNQYISQSFQSLLHLGSDSTASATLTEIQDALGNGVGIFVNTSGNLKANGAISASAVSASTLNGLGSPYNFSSSVSTQLFALENVTSSLISKTGSYATTGSNNFVGNQTITGDVDINGTLTVTNIHTITESSSVIFSSGSNILGDSISDTQTLNGLVRVSGSSQITGSMGISANLTIKGEVSASYISSSRIQGLGNTTVSDFSSSVAQQFNNVLIYENNNDSKWNDLQPVTASLITSVSNLNQYTASISGTNQFTASVSSSLYNLNNKTGSYATTGSNQFTGSQTITGSVYGNVSTLSITSNTASMNASNGNFFYLTLVSGSTTRLQVSNVGVGQTVNLLVDQPSVGYGTIVIPSTIKQQVGNSYSATPSASASDILTFIAFDNRTFLSSVKNLS